MIRTFQPADSTTATTRRIVRPQIQTGASSAAPQESFSPSISGRPQGKPIFSAAELAEANQPKVSEPVRAEVKACIDQIKDLPISGVKATTRSMPRTEYFTPEAPKTISAQRYQFDFEKSQGNNVGLIVDCESGYGHCQPVVPGDTRISGAHIAFLSDSANSRSTGVTLNRSETKYLLESLYGRFSNPMTRTQADRGNHLISACFAVYGKDGGQADTVHAAHRQMAAALKPEQGSAEGWNLRG